MPEYQQQGDSGFDVQAINILEIYRGDKKVENDKLEIAKKGFNDRGFIKLRGFERILFDTGLTVADMPEYLELQVRSRSGIALKRGLSVLNSPGTIDSAYRGKIGIIIQNNTPHLIEVKRGERIAQIVPSRVRQVELFESDEITATTRGDSGFGSTGTL